jgi:serine-type D-Ala-D-Ala carboxypeptidase (penicillin-binding protein 5/6)
MMYKLQKKHQTIRSKVAISANYDRDDLSVYFFAQLYVKITFVEAIRRWRKLKMFYKKSVILGIIFTLFATMLFSGVGSKAYAEAPQLDIKAKAAILVEVETGKILYAQNPDEILPPASMTKMMTEYLILEAIEKGKLDWDSPVSVSPFLSDLSHNRGLSNVDLRSDAEPAYTVRELMEALAIYSANAAAMALAEKVAGTETAFVQMMNEKGKELGLKDFKFVNSTGLNNRDLQGNHPAGESDEENMMSARDAATLAYHLLKDYPEVLEFARIPKKVFREGTEDAIPMENWNWMLSGLIKEYPGVDGLKTGSTDSGASFTATAEKNGMRLISVVMIVDQTDNIADREQRFDETRKLLDFGFNNFTKEEIVPANFQPKGKSTLPVVKGKEKNVEIATKKPLSTIVLRGEKEMYKTEVIFDKKLLNKDGALTAPVKKGEKVGVVKLKYTGEADYGFVVGGVAETELVTQGNVEKANWFVLMLRGIGGFFSDIWNAAIGGIKGLF